MPNTYYVYSLKDPRTKPAQIFYIGKGTGSRATDHLKKVDDTRKGKHIQEILDSGGVLHNTVIPQSIKRKIDDKVNVPNGCVEKAQFVP